MKELEEFDIAVEKKFGPAMNKCDFQHDPDYADFVTTTYDCYEYDEVSPSKMQYIDDIKDEHDIDTYDQYVGAHVRVPIGDDIRSGKLVQRKRELDHTARGRANANSMLDTRTYEIEFPDGRSDEYTANVIAENMCMPSVILKADNTFSWKALLTTKLMDMPLRLMICTPIMAATRK
jgi:hypothetical protein